MTPTESLIALIDTNLARDPHFYDDPNAPKALPAPTGWLDAGRFLTVDELRDLRPARAQGHSNLAMAGWAYDDTRVRFMNGRRPPAVNVEDPRPSLPAADLLLLSEETR